MACPISSLQIEAIPELATSASIRGGVISTLTARQSRTIPRRRSHRPTSITTAGSTSRSRIATVARVMFTWQDQTPASRIPGGFHLGPDATIRVTEAADLNGDRLIDIVATDERTGVAIYFGKPDGTFAS